MPLLVHMVERRFCFALLRHASASFSASSSASFSASLVPLLVHMVERRLRFALLCQVRVRLVFLVPLLAPP